MKEKELNKILLVVCIFSFLFFVCSVLFSKDGRVFQKAQKTTILNPKYKDEVRTVLLSSGGLELKLSRYGDVWVEEQGGQSALCESKLVDSLIGQFSKIRNVYKIADDYTRSPSYGSDGMTDFSISFFGTGEKSLSQVRLFSSDSITRRVSFAPSQTGEVYETEDDFFHLLNLDMNFWAAGEIFFGIADPVEVSFSSSRDGGVEEKGKITESDFSFKTVSYGLLKLRHGQIAGKSVAGKNPVLEITVHDGNARAARVSVFSDGGEFFLARSVVPSGIFDTDETSFALLLENVVYEISGWTYAQLRQSLGLPSEDGKSAGVSRLQDF